MLEQDLNIPAQDVRRLLAAACPDAALLYLYLHTGGEPEKAAQALRFTARQMDYAAASLRQTGLYPEPDAARAAVSAPPVYTEHDIAHEYETNPQFPAMVGETQRRLGRVLSSEELKTLLGIYRYLGLPVEVISILIHYCTERCRSRDPGRIPTIRMIEKEAYRWADLGIDTLEEAAVYMQSQLQLQARARRIRAVLQIEERKLTAGEEKLIHTWLSWGFGENEIRAAYEKTCMNTGCLKWPYLHSILKSWHEQGFTSLREIESSDRAAQARQPRPKPQQNVIQHGDEMGEFERRAMEKMMQKGLYKEGE